MSSRKYRGNVSEISWKYREKKIHSFFFVVADGALGGSEARSRCNHSVAGRRAFESVGMALTITSGGSLTTALSLTLLAWGIRALRGAALRSILEDTSSRFQNLKGLNFLLSRLLLNRKYKNAKAVGISPDAFTFLIRERPVPFVVFEVSRDDRRRGGRRDRGRERDASSPRSARGLSPNASASSVDGHGGGSELGDGTAMAAARRPRVLGEVQCFPEHTLKDLLIQSITLPRGLRTELSGGGAAEAGAGAEAAAGAEGRPAPPLALKLSKADLVVLVSESGDDIQQLACFTCDLGYRCVFLKGGIRALEAEDLGASAGLADNGDGTASEGAGAGEGMGLSRDAIWALMYLCKTSELGRKESAGRADDNKGDSGPSSSSSNDRNGAGRSRGGSVGAGFEGECRFVSSSFFFSFVIPCPLRRLTFLFALAGSSTCGGTTSSRCSGLLTGRRTSRRPCCLTACTCPRTTGARNSAAKNRIPPRTSWCWSATTAQGPNGSPGSSGISGMCGCSTRSGERTRGTWTRRCGTTLPTSGVGPALCPTSSRSRSSKSTLREAQPSSPGQASSEPFATASIAVNNHLHSFVFVFANKR